MSNFTFRNNIWKEPSTDMVVPSNSRPFNNSDVGTIGRTPYRPNPIKQWRKQLFPHYKTSSSKQVSIRQLDAPGTGISVDPYNIDCTIHNIRILKENITMLNACNGTKVYLEDGVNNVKCIGGTNKVRRSANTNISKNYHRNYHSYLKSKCRTYEENARLGSQNDDGTYKSSKCSTSTSSDGTTCDKPIIYKPSNKIFSIQGATSSSANILRKKNDTIYKNNASLKNSYKSGMVSLNNVYDTESGTGYHLNYIKGDPNQQKCNKELNSIRNKKRNYS
jgi:hypothetical protein